MSTPVPTPTIESLVTPPAPVPAGDPIYAKPAPVVAEPTKEAPPAPAPTIDPAAAAAKPADPAAPVADPNSKPDDKSKETPPPEVKYELKLPGESPLKPEDLAAVEAFAKEHKIAPELAQKLLERESNAVVSFRKAVMDGYNKQAEGWKTQIFNDKEIGGSEANFKKTFILANRVFQEFGTPELGKELSITSLGNHPEITRFAVRVAKALGEDKFLTPSKDATPRKKSDAELFYPKKEE